MTTKLQKLSTLAICGAMGLAVSACALVKTPVQGSLFTDVQSGQGATANLLSKKMGEACATSILGLVATGDASISAAAKAGGIKRVSHVDEYANSIWFVYGKYCTRVYGE